MSLEDSAKRVAEFVKLQNDHLIQPDGLPSVEATTRYVELTEKMPSDFAEIVREARRFAEIVKSVCSTTHPGDLARRFLNATAPIVGDKREEKR